MKDNSTEILFQPFLQADIVSTFVTGRNVHCLTSKSGQAAAAICGTFYDRLLRCISDRVISPMKIFCPSALYILTTFVLLSVGAEKGVERMQKLRPFPGPAFVRRAL